MHLVTSPKYLPTRYRDTTEFCGCCFISQIQDINDRKIAEEALARKAAQLSALYQVSQDIVSQLDVEQVCAAAHHAVEQLIPTEAFFIALLDEARQEVQDAYLFDQGQRCPNERDPLAQRGM